MSKKEVINYCIVGLGGHSENKIVPAIYSSRNNLWGVVTKRKNVSMQNTKFFRNLNSAITSCPKNTLFIISNEPRNHFRNAKKILDKGFSVLIEKPIVLHKKEIDELTSSIKYNFFCECFMYRYSIMNFKIKRFIKNNKKIRKIDIVFTIPRLPSRSFRNEKKMSSSLIYDMGCYAYSFINENKIKLMKLNLVDVNYKGDISKEKFKIEASGHLNKQKVQLNLKFGIGKKYQNQISIFQNNNRHTFRPFFYGRKSTKTIAVYKNNKLFTKDTFTDKDAFYLMFDRSIENWKKEFFVNKKISSNNIEMLEETVRQYKSYKSV